MVRRRRKRIKRQALDYVSLPQIDLEPETKRSIAVIIILGLGALSALSLFEAAGKAGEFISYYLMLFFGWGKWFFPVLMLTLGFLIYYAEKYLIRKINYLGIFLFLVAIQALFHIFLPRPEWRELVSEGVGGGFAGLYLASFFYKILSFWGALLVLLSLLLISLVIAFETSLSRLIGSQSMFAKLLYPFKLVFTKLFYRNDDKKYSDYEEDEEDLEEESEEIADENFEEDEEVGFSKSEVGEPEFMYEDEPTQKTQTKPIEEKESLWKKSDIKIDLPLELLNNKRSKPTSGDIKNNALIIQRTLENFGIMVQMGNVEIGPTVTQYTFKPAEGVKLSRITTLSNDLALALAAHPIRIEAPIPGKSLVGVEVPNQTKAIVGLREILSSEQFKTKKNNLTLAIGKDVSGKSWTYDLSKMPHMLVAGATNSGKSVCLNALIVSLLYQNNPDDLKFIMVDPKRVELPMYNGIPHLLTPVITDVPKTINALKWCLNEMDRRFEILSQKRKKDIQSFNASSKEKLPYLVFIIDELADLMVAASRDIEGSVIRLAQMARAVGIHLILATQRPSVDVITGLIKANMPARIAFSVASGVDSKTILDSLGAEKLLGQGDMLFITAEISKPKRLQGAFVSELEIKKVVNYIKEKGGHPNYLEGITDRQKVSGIGGHGLNGGRSDDDDELLEEAKELIINSGKASASFLQRRLSVGYARAARLLDILEDRGVIGPANGAKPREIMVSKEQYEAIINQGISGAPLHNREESQAPEEYFDTDENEEVEDEKNLDNEDQNNFPEENEDDDDQEKNKKKEDEEAKKEKNNITQTKPQIKNQEPSNEDEDDGIYFSK